MSDAEEPRWYYRGADGIRGPFDDDAITVAAEIGVVTPDTLVKTAEMEEWVPAGMTSLRSLWSIGTPFKPKSVSWPAPIPLAKRAAKNGPLSYVMLAAVCLSVFLYLRHLVNQPNIGTQIDPQEVARRSEYLDGEWEADRTKDLIFTESEMAAAARSGKSEAWCRGYYNGVMKNRAKAADEEFKNKHKIR